MLKLTSLLQAGKIDNLEEICGVFVSIAEYASRPTANQMKIVCTKRKFLPYGIYGENLFV